MSMSSDGGEAAVVHEVTHAISFNAIHHQPRWFAEGLASYFETIQLNAPNQHVDVGEQPRSLTRTIRRKGLLNPSTLFACEKQDTCSVSDVGRL
jgi:hypothetical protein